MATINQNTIDGMANISMTNVGTKRTEKKQYNKYNGNCQEKRAVIRRQRPLAASSSAAMSTLNLTSGDALDRFCKLHYLIAT